MIPFYNTHYQHFREDVPCFGEDTCYSLAFGVPAILMLVATIFFVIGKPFYVMKEPEGSITTKVIGSISHATVKRFTSSEKKEHWMDHAEDKYDKTLIADVKTLLRVLVIFIPIPAFWALFDQTVIYARLVKMLKVKNEDFLNRKSS